MHAVIALVTGLVFLAGGLLLKALGASGQSRNPVAGYRTPRSMKSPEAWMAANRYAGKAFYLAGAIILVTGVILWWKPLPRFNEFIILGLLFIALVSIVLATESYLKRHFNDDGSPKAALPGGMEKPAPADGTGVQRAGKLPYSRLEYLLELLSVAGVIFSVILLIRHWPQLPALVPRHFNFQGMVDAWGGKGSLAALPITNGVLYLIMTLPRIFLPLYAAKSNSQRSLALSMELMAWLKACTVGSLSYVTWRTVEIALGRSASLSPLFLPLLMIAFLVIIVVYCYLIIRVQSEKQAVEKWK